MADSLGKKAVKGVAWTTIQRFTTIGIQFVSGIILARILTPDDYGCIGMLSIFMLIAGTFVDGGFGSALIQKKRPTQEDYSTIFHWNLAISLILYFILFFCAPAISRFYRTPLLCPVLRIQGLVLIINALSAVQISQLNKQFKFKKIAVVTIVTSILSLCITIYMAYKGFGVWALVAQNLVTAFIPCLIYWFSNGWFPSFVFSKQSFKELFSFGFYIFMSNLLNTICNNVQGLLIGHLYNPSTMGYYSKAHSTEKLASTTISNTVTQVSYPLYAELQDNKNNLIAVIKKLTTSLAFLIFPMIFFLILVAKPVFVLLYSDKWLQSVPYFQILCIAGLATCMQSVNAQAIAAIGKSKVMFQWTIIKQTVGLTMIVGGLYLLGIKGMLVGMVIRSWFVYIVNASLVSKYIGYRNWRQFGDLLPILLLSSVSFFAAYLLTYLLDLNMYTEAVFGGLVFFGVYLGLSLLFHIKALSNVKQMIRSYLLKK